jgi:hypothetical protein
MMTKDTDLISVGDAAEAYSLSRATLFRLIGDDKLKSYKRRIGDRKTYVSKAALRRLLVPVERE